MRIRPEETLFRGRWIFHGGRYHEDEAEVRASDLVRFYLRRIALSNWTALFVDPHDGRYWQQTFPQSDLPGLGPMALRCISETEARAIFGEFDVDGEEPLSGPFNRLKGATLVSAHVQSSCVTLDFGEKGVVTAALAPTVVVSNVATTVVNGGYREKLHSLVGSIVDAAGTPQQARTTIFRFTNGSSLVIAPPADAKGAIISLHPAKPS